MKRFIIYLLPALAGLLAGSCTTVAEPEGDLSAAPLVIRSGTSFGMCMGYCYTEVAIASETTTLTGKSFRNKEQYPDKQCSSNTTQDDWQALRGLINREALRRLPQTIGCPDCADGGAEWIEVEEGNSTHRVTFEYNSNVPEIGPLLNKVRESRNRQRQQCL